MPGPIITVDGLGKRYRVTRPDRRGGNGLRHALEAGARQLWKGIGRMARGMAPFEDIPREEEFWALRDVSFEVWPGECVGIIGRNGAGKSTLLKVLSRITEPSAGRAILRGRVGSLLEVGTGFHPELTGRENIFLNGAILGMRRHEILRRLDGIVSFAEVGQFLDTPVKRYSTGMHMRLAFAVAAHLDPEILVVDEVLAVGDAQFQKKCLGKMSEVANEGRTVLFVSHQMAMVSALCSRGIALKAGEICFDGPVREAILKYQDEGGCGARFEPGQEGRVIGNGHARLHRAWITNAAGDPADSFDLSEPITVHMEYSVFKRGKLHSYPNFHFYDELGNYFFVTSGRPGQGSSEFNRQGRLVATCTIPGGWLNTGTFSVGVAVTAMEPHVDIAFFERGALMFQVTENMDVTLDGDRLGYSGPIPGTLRPRLPWSVRLVGPAEDLV